MIDPVPELIRDDGTLWQPSYKSEGAAVAALFNPNLPQFFFREVKSNDLRKWWCPWRNKYRHTGRTWEGHTLAEGAFTVIRV